MYWKYHGRAEAGRVEITPEVAACSTLNKGACLRTRDRFVRFWRAEASVVTLRTRTFLNLAIVCTPFCLAPPLPAPANIHGGINHTKYRRLLFCILCVFFACSWCGRYCASSSMVTREVSLSLARLKTRGWRGVLKLL